MASSLTNKHKDIKNIGNHSEGIQTLKELVTTHGVEYPCIVRIPASVDNISSQRDCRVSDLNLEILIEKPETVRYARATVLQLKTQSSSSSKYRDGKGMTVCNKYVDKTFLLPVKFSRQVKLTHHPRRRQRYASIEQVEEDLPHYVRVDSDTNAMVGVAKSGTIVEIKAITTNTSKVSGSVRYLECISNEGTTFNFKVGGQLPINFTGISDSKLYSLRKISRSILLPKIVEFQDIAKEDIVEYETQMANDVFEVAKGTLEFLAVTENSMLIGWAKENVDKNTVSYKTALIPEEMWKHIPCLICKFENQEDKMAYIEANYVMCRDTSFIHEGLYFIDESKWSIKWLKRDVSEQKYERPKQPTKGPVATSDTDKKATWKKRLKKLLPKATGKLVSKNKSMNENVFSAEQMHVRRNEQDKRKISTSSDDSHIASSLDIEQSTDMYQNHALPHIPILSMQTIGKLKQVHEHSFGIPFTSPNPYDKIAVNEDEHSENESIDTAEDYNDMYSKDGEKNTLIHEDDEIVPYYIAFDYDEISLVEDLKLENVVEKQQMAIEKDKERNEKNDGENDTISTGGTICNDKKETFGYDIASLLGYVESKTVEGKEQNVTESRNQLMKNGNEEHERKSFSKDGGQIYIIDDNSETVDTCEYEDISLKNDMKSEHVDREKIQTENLEFCKKKRKSISEYTVNEVAELFEKYSFHSLAGVCKENKIDGPFLVQLEASHLREEPFSLTEEHFETVRDIIFGTDDTYIHPI